MQLTHGEWKEIASTVPRHNGIGATLQAVIKAWRRLGVLASLLLASAGYVVFGGAFEWPSAPEPKTPIAAVAAEPTVASGAPVEQRVSGSSATIPDYFPAAYPNRGRDGDGNVMTYEHD